MNLDALDGTIGQGWGGLSPNGSHVNVILARRGSPTAAAISVVVAGQEGSATARRIATARSSD